MFVEHDYVSTDTQAAAAASDSPSTYIRCPYYTIHDCPGLDLEKLHAGRNKHPKPRPRPGKRADVLIETRYHRILDKRSQELLAAEVPDFLSRNECSRLIDYAETVGMESVDTQYLGATRACMRTLLRAPTVAQQLFDRIAPILQPSDYAEALPMCFGQGGVWFPRTINDVVKIMRYDGDAGHQFMMHRDGPWVPHEDQASLLTILIYLNDNFEEGQTNFCRNVHNQNARVTPQTGKVVFFRHELQHAGRPPVGGSKYVLRAELIFERAAPSPRVLADRYYALRSKEYADMVRKYERAHTLGDAGDKAGFMSEYQEVIVAQRAAADADEMKQAAAVERQVRCGLLSCLNPDALGDVLLFLPDDALPSLLQTCEAMNMAVLRSPMWRERAVIKFGDALERVVGASLDRGVRDSCSIPWLVIYRQQCVWSERFAATALWFLTDGCAVAVPDSWGFDHEEYSQRWRQGFSITEARLHPVYATPPNVADAVTDAGILHGRLPDVNLRWTDAYQQDHYHTADFMCSGAAFATSLGLALPQDKMRWQSPKGPPKSVTPVVGHTSNDAELSVLRASVERLFDPAMTPLLLVDHPLWYDEGQAKLLAHRRRAVRDAFEAWQTPAVLPVSITDCITTWLAATAGCCRDEVNADVFLQVAQAHTGDLSAMAWSPKVRNDTSRLDPYILCWRRFVIRGGRHQHEQPPDEVATASPSAAVASASDTRVSFSEALSEADDGGEILVDRIATTARQGATEDLADGYRLVLLFAGDEGLDTAEGPQQRVATLVREAVASVLPPSGLVVGGVPDVMTGAAAIAAAPDIRTRCIFRHVPHSTVADMIYR